MNFSIAHKHVREAIEYADGKDPFVGNIVYVLVLAVSTFVSFVGVRHFWASVIGALPFSSLLVVSLLHSNSERMSEALKSVGVDVKFDCTKFKAFFEEKSASHGNVLFIIAVLGAVFLLTIILTRCFSILLSAIIVFAMGRSNTIESFLESHGLQSSVFYVATTLFLAFMLLSVRKPLLKSIFALFFSLAGSFFLILSLEKLLSTDLGMLRFINNDASLMSFFGPENPGAIAYVINASFSFGLQFFYILDRKC